jgi:anti-anti-sigma factor
VLSGILRHEEAKQIAAQTHEAMTGGAISVIFDMSGVEYMNSTAIGSLVNGAAAMEGAGGKAVLTALRPTMERVLATLGLVGMFHKASTLEEALRILHR